MMPSTIHQIWLGDTIEVFESLMKTVKDNSELEVIVWEYNSLKEQGFITPKIQNLLDIKAPYAYISNLLRFDILTRFGGLYLDADFFCKKSLVPLYEEYKDASLVVAERGIEELEYLRKEVRSTFPKYPSGVVGSEKGYDFTELTNTYQGTHLIGEMYSEFVTPLPKLSIVRLLNNEYLRHQHQLSHKSIDLR